VRRFATQVVGDESNGKFTAKGTFVGVPELHLFVQELRKDDQQRRVNDLLMEAFSESGMPRDWWKRHHVFEDSVLVGLLMGFIPATPVSFTCETMEELCKWRDWQTGYFLKVLTVTVPYEYKETLYLPGIQEKDSFDWAPLLDAETDDITIHLDLERFPKEWFETFRVTIYTDKANEEVSTRITKKYPNVEVFSLV